MANIRPAPDRPRPPQRSRFWPRIFKTVSVSVAVLTPVAVLSLWLLMTDPVTAAAVMERGDLLPVLVALAKIFGKLMMSVLSSL